jgi:hypothetical protein
MLPVSTMPNSVDRLRANAIEPPELWGRDANARSNFQNFSLCKLGSAVGSPKQAVLAALGDLIRNVVGICSKEQMSRIYAELVIATMTDMQIVRDRAVKYLKRDAMGALRLRAYHYLTVPLGRAGKPVPALVRTSGRGLCQQPILQSRLHPSGHERNLP